MTNGIIVLEGGATRGVFTSGVLDFLMEQEIYFSNVLGVSAGACNGVNYVARQHGRMKDCTIQKEKEYQYISFRKFVKTKALFDMDLIFDKYPNEIFPFDYDTFFGSSAHCEVVVTNCKTGQAEYLGNIQKKEELMKACRASSSMPLLAPIVNVEGIPYLDGGLADSVPIKRAIELEHEKIIVVLTRRKGYRKAAPSKGSVKIYRRAYKKYPQLVETIRRRNIRYNRTMDLIDELEEQGRIFVIRPEMKTVSRVEQKYEVLLEFYEHGYKMMQSRMDEMKAYLEKESK